MKAIIALTLTLISINSFAGSDECLRQFRSIVHRSNEATRLENAAIDRGFNIETGAVDSEGNVAKHAARLMELANKHHEVVEKMEPEFIKNCLK